MGGVAKSYSKEFNQEIVKNWDSPCPQEIASVTGTLPPIVGLGSAIYVLIPAALRLSFVDAW